jgi:hypothetical protein
MKIAKLTYFLIKGINFVNLKTKHRISGLEAAVSRKTLGFRFC